MREGVKYGGALLAATNVTGSFDFDRPYATITVAILGATKTPGFAGQAPEGHGLQTLAEYVGDNLPDAPATDADIEAVIKEFSLDVHSGNLSDTLLVDDLWQWGVNERGMVAKAIGAALAPAPEGVVSLCPSCKGDGSRVLQFDGHCPLAAYHDQYGVRAYVGAR